MRPGLTGGRPMGGATRASDRRVPGGGPRLDGRGKIGLRLIPRLTDIGIEVACDVPLAIPVGNGSE
eukprot:3704298-Alexandrium_andersonii.AAC.1